MARSETAESDVAGPVALPALGPIGWLRWAWRQLTSMRTALFLLLLLAVGAVPGSIWPQRSIDAARTADYIAQHATTGPWLDRLGFFEVYASPWFSAIYLLLFISLVGCVLPRSKAHWKALRSQPSRAPRRLDRLPEHRSAEVVGTVDDVKDDVLDAARTVLRDKRFRVVGHRESVDGESVSGEAGYLKETGNLAFHLALVLVIVGVAWGHLLGWKGDVIVPTGQTFADTLSRFDTFSPGPWVDPEKLTPFTVTVDRLDASFEDTTTGRGQFGAPRDFTAYTTVVDRPGDASRTATIKVNHPLEMGGATVFLLGNGYAPVITVRDSTGAVVYHDATPFLAQDNNYKSVGAVKVAGARPKQLGFFGLFLPTAVIDPELGPTSIFPDARRPALALGLYEGELFPSGRPQSVYTLDTEKLTQVKDDKGQPLRIWLEPGKTVQLPGGRGSITLDGVERFAGLSVRNDPGKWLTLWSALLALAGLITSLVVKRRRVFVRVAASEADQGRTVVTVAGLSKDDDVALGERLEQLLQGVLDTMRQRTQEKQ